MKKLTTLLFYLIVPIALFILVQYAFLFPQAVFGTHPYPWKTQDLYSKQHVFIHASNASVPAYYHDGGTKALIVFFHGNNETIPMHFPAFDNLAQLGYSVLLTEYPRYHNGKGTLTQEGIIATQLAAIKKFQKPNQSLIYWGRSLGGGIALQVQKHHPSDKLILESTFIRPTDFFADNLFWHAINKTLIVNMNAEDTINHLGANMPKQVLILHGDKDGVIPFARGTKMFSLFKTHGVTPSKHYFSGGHNDRGFSDQRVWYFLEHIVHP
jgi:alpha-beta hydrolase superfamily lysophospholipase